MDGRRVTHISDSIFASCCSDVTLNTRRRFVNLETVAFAKKISARAAKFVLFILNAY